ncbi:PREDICTED: xylosyltransferase oxt [Papilio xuthus]|uniref:protein xylosyltransferase n=1 Tax=Papilio xuthus TaxID=66420 RepID=A0AAJ6ZGG1_PAPXU|nr:PREDICTED: xylosyltransferase oxt [Papilio xuthus]
MAFNVRKFFYKYAKWLGATVLTTFFIQILISISLFPTVNDNLLKKFGHTSLERHEFGDVSARKIINGYSDDEDIHTKTSSQTKSTPHLRIEELDFKPACDIKSREAVSAIHRAKTQSCKQEIVNKTCLIQNGNFYPTKLPNKCPSNGMTYGKYYGCYLDEKKLRILSSFYGNYATTNSPEFCVDICMQAGFPYAGVQYASECFCGDVIPPESAKTMEGSCNMKCPGNSTKICGGYFTMNIYETGLTKFVPITPKLSSNVKESVRIVFLLTLNGRALRQVHRLINVLYRSHHYFYIHVDKRQDYMHRKLSALEKKFQNVRLAPNRYATIWGGASLLKMLLSSMKDFMSLGWQWDYVINLSESDFPIKSLEDLETFLSVNKGLNFVKSHGREVQRFIKKQGLDKTFIECETHMWRVGERKLPQGIIIDGGSDWIALSPEFVSYVVGKHDELLSGLHVIFQHTLLPAESFFHTVLRNSIFCNTYVDNNLHVTNWKRKLGCKCQYKHVVDWCGCSPNDFRTEDWPRIQNTLNRQLFFARKFEPVINQEVITRVEQLIGLTDHYHINNLEGYWQNIYDIEDLPASTDDTLLSHAGSILRQNAKILLQEDCTIELGEVHEINLYKYADVYKGNLILYKALIENEHEVFIETWYKPKHYLEINSKSQYSDIVKIFKVSSDYDQKEMTFRNFGSILGPLSEPSLVYQFSLIEKLTENLTVILLDPAGIIAEVNTIYKEENNLTNFIKFNVKTPLLPGVWKVTLLEQNYVPIAMTKFLVTPLEYFSGKEMSHQETSLIHSGSSNSYKNYSQIKDIDLLPSKKDSLLLQDLAFSNIKRIGHDLREWIDSLNVVFYDILGSCLSGDNFKDKLICGKNTFRDCVSTDWSSLSPDPKGTIGKLNLRTGRLERI